jgi:hypothetical protein
MAQKLTQSDWEDRAKRYLKAQLKRMDMTYEELAKRMKAHGFDETKVSVSNKLSRGTFAASWFLAVLAALELDLSPFSHPSMSRVCSSFEPVWLGCATGRGA